MSQNHKGSGSPRDRRPGDDELVSIGDDDREQHAEGSPSQGDQPQEAKPRQKPKTRKPTPRKKPQPTQEEGDGSPAGDGQSRGMSFPISRGRRRAGEPSGDETASRPERRRPRGGDARLAWRQAFSDGSEGRRQSAVRSTSKAMNQFRISVADAHEKRQPAAFFSVVAAFLLMLLRLLGTFLKLIWRFLVVLAVTLVAIGMIGLIGAGYLYASTIAEVPQLEDFSLIAMPQDSTIYDCDGEVIGVISTSKREPVAFGEIAQPVKDAVVAIEDERFYNHEGVDLFGIARALFANFQSWSGGKSVAQGASTITQQYVRNAYQDVGNDISMRRKLTEMMLAAQLEARASKDEILNSYLNTVYYGNGCYGVEAASQYYFAKSAKDLDYYESAVLAAIVNGPSIYNPATEEGRTNTASRANVILDKMYSLGKLGGMTQDDLRAVKQTNINDRIHITEKERVINQPYYYDYVMRELKKTYTDEQIVSGGWQIYTTLSMKDGNAATDVVKTVEEAYGDDGVTAAIADVSISDGSVHAFCGGTDYSVTQFNIAADGRLQNGSTLKPFLYASMVDEMGYFVTDPVNCDPINVAADDEPAHMITSYLKGGMHSIEEGIIHSDNAMAVRCADIAGMDRVERMLKSCGAVHDLDDNSIAIIGGQTEGYTPLELATVYATLGNGGVARSLWCVRSITDNYGNTVYEHKDDSHKAMEPETAKQITHSMEEAVKQRGDWYDIAFARNGWHIAAKTGTTDDKTDLWSCGFDHNRAAVVWLGGRDAKVEVPTTTPTAARRLSDYFYAVGQGDSKEGFEQPEYKTKVPAPDPEESADAYVKRLGEHHLVPKVAYVTDNSMPEGKVKSVSHKDEMVARNTSVTVDIVRNKVVVPDFVALKTPKAAYESAEGLTLLFSVKYATSGSAIPEITAQSVKAGESVDHGTSVTLDVTVATPLVNGTETQVPYRSSEDILTVLSADRDGLRSENKSLQSQVDSLNDDVAKLEGELQEAQSSQGTTENTGGGLRIYVPNVRGLTVKEARQVLTSLGLMSNAAGASEGDIVGGTNPAIGSIVSTGTTIKITARTSSPSGDGDGESDGGQSGSGDGDDSESGSDKEEGGDKDSKNKE